MASDVAFDFADVLPTIRRAHSGASTEDAEDAIQTAVVELLAAGEPLKSSFVVTRARSRLIDAKKRKEAQNVSLDGIAEDTEDHAPVELAVQEVDYEAHVELSTARENPILRRRIASGGRVKRWSRALIAEAVRAVAREDGKLPTAEKMKTDTRLPSQSVFYRYYKSWEEAVREAGLTYEVPTPGNRWTLDEGTAALKAWVAEHGRLPTTEDLRNGAAIGLPSQMACYRLYGSCSQARLGAVVWGDDAGRILAAIAILRARGRGRNDDLAAQLAEFVGG